MTDKNSSKYVTVEINDQKATKVKLGIEWKIIFLSLIPDLKNSFGVGLVLLPAYIASYLFLEFIYPQLNITILLSFFLPNFLYATIRNKIFLHDCIEKKYRFFLGVNTTKEDLERYLSCEISNEIFMKTKKSHEDKNKKEYCFKCKKETISNSNFCSQCGCEVIEVLRQSLRGDQMFINKNHLKYKIMEKLAFYDATEINELKELQEKLELIQSIQRLGDAHIIDAEDQVNNLSIAIVNGKIKATSEV